MLLVLSFFFEEIHTIAVPSSHCIEELVLGIVGKT